MDVNAAVQQALADKLLEAAKIAEDEIDREIERLERLDEDDLEGIRQRRLAEMKKAEQQKKEWLQLGHGEYSDLANESEFFDACKKSKNVVVHFYRDETMRCGIVDKHLRLLAGKHPEARFLRIAVDKAPFLCTRMKIRVLPTIVLFKDFKSCDYIIGFDDLGGRDEFSTEMMEWRIAQKAVINYAGDLSCPPDEKPIEKRKPILGGIIRKNIRGRIRNDSDDEDTEH
ncbi:thioredoxin domain-containing protein 9 homolog isoform X4 [Varroa jacobsoni]|uniref:Thioredoxin domain-containing protein 9 n=2 Tax=Varroa TaxID=62624 RepID=A0A7M7K009_VARDE|nr:thioredoxin domain-containing protein 9 homolog [Varroa destructor]XP_022658253.1 thioredoxin domain-containing protein 9 homolog [Varroa destructor]XP_022658254.1 thioredoxin domain-containing protein 9 homolog [Varroa destructor]XP_022688027.1 thioredoxin domain-containing protein 9 homolog isoform X4 [Varroa jacobsoni]XP_022688028.1 thioredoxin domain-containing protein 9 homolog isoform X4 [Varroa jacobsoni]XP_022688029.1 thioredoxin domain-containing protein 9 homolog isoform X4 [Varro